MRRRPIVRVAALLNVMAACGGQLFSTAAGDADDAGSTGGGGATGSGGAAGGRDGGGGSGAADASHDGSDPDGSGGSAGQGGTGGSGGSMGSGGSAGQGGTGGSGGSMGSGGAGQGGARDSGGGPNSGDCTADDECPNSRCVEVTPGGYRVCEEHFPEATMCAGMQECCNTNDCQKGAICYPAPLAPTCGLAQVASNVCASDLCTSDAACGSGSICVPAGTLSRKVRGCVPVGCRVDTDCNAAANGICAPVSGGCCNDVMGLYCVYPGKGCRSNADCTSHNCTIDPDGASQCSMTGVLCPG